MAKVRIIRNANGQILNEVPPGYPAEIEGWKSLPSAGELVLEVPTERKAREVIKYREDLLQKEKQLKDLKVIETKIDQHQREYKQVLELKRKMGRKKLKQQGPRKPEISDEDTGPSLNLILKADVDGTLEALLDTLDTYDCVEQCKLDLIQYGVGALTENDVELAIIFKGVIYAFNVECPANIKKFADESNITIKHFNVIYKLVDDVKEELNLRLPPKEVEEVLGEAIVLQQFDINEGRRKVPVAGCRCIKGSLKKIGLYKLVRGEEVLYNGTLSSMRHLKNEVDLIKTNVECGLQLTDKSITFQPNDILICYEKKSIPQVTEWDPGF